ncbi:MAG: hypothetical protein ACLVIP_04495 [Ruminococcus sp.]
MKKFNSKSCEEIMTTVYRPIEFCIDNLLAQESVYLSRSAESRKILACA